MVLLKDKKYSIKFFKRKPQIPYFKKSTKQKILRANPGLSELLLHLKVRVPFPEKTKNPDPDDPAEFPLLLPLPQEGRLLEVGHWL